VVKHSKFLKNLGTFVGVQVDVAGQMGVVAYQGAKYLVKKTPSAVKKTQKAAKSVKKTVQKKAPSKPAKYSKLQGGKNVAEFEKKLLGKSLIITIAGKRGSGKSTLGFRIMENARAKKKRPCYVIGVPQEVLPNWIESIEGLDEVKNGGVVLVDEGAISFSSRESMKKGNRQLGKLMAVARHKDLTLILITQNTGMIDKNVLNLTDTVILKQGSLLQERMERDVMKDLYKDANKVLGKIPTKDRPKYSYVVDDEYTGKMGATVPSFWSDKISKNQK